GFTLDGLRARADTGLLRVARIEAEAVRVPKVDARVTQHGAVARADHADLEFEHCTRAALADVAADERRVEIERPLARVRCQHAGTRLLRRRTRHPRAGPAGRDRCDGLAA